MVLGLPPGSPLVWAEFVLKNFDIYVLSKISYYILCFLMIGLDKLNLQRTHCIYLCTSKSNQQFPVNFSMWLYPSLFLKFEHNKRIWYWKWREFAIIGLLHGILKKTSLATEEWYIKLNLNGIHNKRSITLNII